MLGDDEAGEEGLMILSGGREWRSSDIARVIESATPAFCAIDLGSGIPQ